mgnify:CR=1 FL=1
MIILNFIIDYLVLILLPVNTFFIVNELDKNKLFNVVFIGLLVDIMYHKLFIFLLSILFLYLVVRKLKIKNKYYYLKNIMLFIIFFMIVSIFNRNLNIIGFISSLIIQIIYMYLYKRLYK